MTTGVHPWKRKASRNGEAQMHVTRTHVLRTMGQSRAKVMLHASGGLFFDNGSKESPHVTCEVRQMKRLV